ncbi:hypothetical protein [Spirosoma harenae]
MNSRKLTPYQPTKPVRKGYDLVVSTYRFSSITKKVNAKWNSKRLSASPGSISGAPGKNANRDRVVNRNNGRLTRMDTSSDATPAICRHDNRTFIFQDNQPHLVSAPKPVEAEKITGQPADLSRKAIANKYQRYRQTGSLYIPAGVAE